MEETSLTLSFAEANGNVAEVVAHQPSSHALVLG